MIKGITIHNTGNDYSAKELLEMLKEKNRTNLCHYLIDENEIIQVLPEDEMAEHTGKGYDYGNRYTLAVEICRSTSDIELYLKAQKKAIILIKRLMKKYKLHESDLYFHSDFNPNKRCPHRILDIYKTKERFINEYFIQG